MQDFKPWISKINANKNDNFSENFLTTAEVE